MLGRQSLVLMVSNGLKMDVYFFRMEICVDLVLHLRHLYMMQPAEVLIE